MSKLRRFLYTLCSRVASCGKSSAVQTVLFMLAIVWLCSHQYINVSTFEWKMRGTYFSESSLLAENANIGFNTEASRNSILLSQEYQQIPSNEKLKWLDQKMLSASPGRVHTYRHVFYKKSLSLRRSSVSSSSAGSSAGSNKMTRRENVYGILEPRVGANRNEAIVLMAKHRANVNNHNGEEENHSGPDGVGILLSFLQYLSEQTWLSKRIIVVMVDGGTDSNGWDNGLDIGVQRWIEDYTSGQLNMTCGAIRGAILLDVAPGKILLSLCCYLLEKALSIYRTLPR
jgi:hypothetical protein